MTRRRVGALLCSVTAVIAATFPVLSATGASSPAVAVTVDSLTPTIAIPNATLAIRATVIPTGAPLSDATVQLRATAGQIATRGALAADVTTPPDGELLYWPGAIVTAVHGAAGTAIPVTLTVSVSELVQAGLITSTGAYALQVVVSTPAAGQVAVAGTFVPYVDPASPVATSHLAWAVELTAPPVSPLSTPAAVAAFAQLIAPSGHLGSLVGSLVGVTAPPRPLRRGHRLLILAAPRITVAVDPALVQAATLLADGHLPGVAAGSTDATLGQGFLNRLIALAAQTTIIGLPYGDPDVSALVRAGLTGDVVGSLRQSDLTTQWTSTALSTTAEQGVLWPAGGDLSAAALAAAATAGTTSVLVDGEAMPALDTLTYTPSAAQEIPAGIGGSVTAVASDPALSALATETPAGPAPVEQFLADTLVIATELPSTPRHLLVLVPAPFTGTAASLARLIAASDHASWLSLASVNAVASATTTGEREPLQTSGAGALPPAYMSRIAFVRQSLGTITAALVDPEAENVPTLDEALRLAASAQWRSDPAAGTELTTATAAAVASMFHGIRILSGGTISLANSTSTVPISLANDLHSPVIVHLSFTANPAGVSAELPDRITIPAGHTVQVPVKVHVVGGGVFPATVQLSNVAGTKLSSPVTILLKSTAYGLVALAVTYTALGVLLVALVVRLIRRVRRGPVRTPA
jgi:Family of unknown function (DUF6049)